MRLKKDVFLDVIYSILFAIVILLENSALQREDSSLVFIFKNLILISILLLWMKALSRNHSGVLLVVDNSAKNGSSLQSGLRLIREFVEIKICCYVLIFCAYSFFTNKFEFNRIHYYLIQIFAVGFYTLSCYLISAAFFKISVNNWLFLVILLGPFLLLFLIYGIFGLDSYLVFSLLPSNIQIVTLEKIGSPFSLTILGLSAATIITMAVFFFRSLNRLVLGPKYINLPEGRVN